MTHAAELVIHTNDRTGESPTWHPEEQALYWVDIPAGTLHRWRMADQQHTSWRAPQQLACIARLPCNGWIGAMEDGIYTLLRRPDQTMTLQKLADATHEHPGMRFNDGRCDRQGRFWVSTMLADTTRAAPFGKLHRMVSRDGKIFLQPLVDGLITGNGLAFSPDGRTMYLSDSHPQQQRVWVFDYDTNEGVPTNRRLFIDRLPSGRPDGAAVDVAGCYWICGNDAGVIYRYTPQGKLDRSLSIPAVKPAMCAFGGPGLDTLFVTTIRTSQSAPCSLDGALFALNPGTTGLVETPFTHDSRL